MNYSYGSNSAGFDPNHLNMYQNGTNYGNMYQNGTRYGNGWEWEYPPYQPLPPPSRNIHVNPAFYQVSGPPLSSSGKIIVNPKFFNVSKIAPVLSQEIESTATIFQEPSATQTVESEPESKFTDKSNTIIVSKKYSWKKLKTKPKSPFRVDQASRTLSKFRLQKPIASIPKHGSNHMLSKAGVSSSSFKRRFSNSGSRLGHHSKYKVDKRLHVTPKRLSSGMKTIHTKYKIVRNVSKMKPFDTRFTTSVMSSKLPSTPLTKFTAFTRNKWRPLSTAAKVAPRKASVKDRKMKARTPRRKPKPSDAKRYYNTSVLQKSVDNCDHTGEEVEYEVTEKPLGLRSREPLGELPMFITLS